MQQILNSIKQGIIRGLSVQPLPPKLYNFYNHILFRIFRVIGGISILLVLSKIHLLLPNFLKYLVIALGLIQFIQMTVFFFLKSVYGIRLLIYNREVFQIKISPLDEKKESENINDTLLSNNYSPDLYIIIVFIIYSLIIIKLIPYLEINYPLFYYGVINHFIYYKSTYLLLLFSWPLLFSIYNTIELYFFSVHCYSNSEFKLPKYLPKYLNKHYTELYKIRKTDEKISYLHLLFRNLIFGLMLSLTCCFLVYFYLFL